MGWNEDISFTLNSTDVHGVAGFLPTQGSKAQGIGYEMNRAPTLRAGCDNYGIHKVVAPTLTASNNPSRSPQSTEVTNQVASVYEASMAVRRLTPVECERLQGFPDNYTQIPWRKKEADVCPDGPRYKAMGNSMAVPVMKWIGQRIQEGVK
jgi:DNA (cytosine-5)-methyltransferase 1